VTKTIPEPRGLRYENCPIECRLTILKAIGDGGETVYNYLKYLVAVKILIQYFQKLK